jgi:hypothetical protein
MMAIWQKFGFATLGAIVSLSAIEVESAQAASFSFNFGGSDEGTLKFTDSFLTGIGRESARLDELENVEFNYQFSNFNSGSYPYPPLIYYSYPAYAPADSSISFNFNEGNLVGIDLSARTSVERSFYGGSRGGSIQGEAVLITKGDRFFDFFEGSEQAGGFDTCTSDEFRNVCTFSSFEANSSSTVEANGILLEQSGYNEIISDITEYQTGRNFRETERTPFSSSKFVAFADFPGQITFTTLEAIPRDSEAVPEPGTMLGVGTTAIVGGFLKRRQPKKTKR